MSGVCEYLTELETKIVVGELALREIENVYSQHQWQRTLSPETIRIILRDIMQEADSDDLETKEGKLDIPHYEKLLRFFEGILKDIICAGELNYPVMSSKEECETTVSSALDKVTEFSKENVCSFQLSLEMQMKIEELVKRELGVIITGRGDGIRRRRELINYSEIVKEIKPDLLTIGLNLAERYHPILFAEKQSVIKKVLDKILDRILEIDVKNAQKSIEYGYLEKDPHKIKKNIYDAALSSLDWSIKKIFDDLIVDYAS